MPDRIVPGRCGRVLRLLLAIGGLVMIVTFAAVPWMVSGDEAYTGFTMVVEMGKYIGMGIYFYVRYAGSDPQLVDTLVGGIDPAPFISLFALGLIPISGVLYLRHALRHEMPAILRLQRILVAEDNPNYPRIALLLFAVRAAAPLYIAFNANRHLDDGTTWAIGFWLSTAAALAIFVFPLTVLAWAVRPAISKETVVTQVQATIEAIKNEFRYE